MNNNHEIVNGHIIFKSMLPDHFPENPLKSCDAMGSIFSFNNRHIDSIDHEQARALREEYKEDAILLSYFEHGACLWGVAGTMDGMPDFRWDGRHAAGLWIPDKYLLKDAEGLEPKERREKMEKWASEACNLYTQYANGEVYAVVVRAYKIRKSESGEIFDRESDYRHDTPVFEESCGGIFGEDCARQTMEDEFVKMAKDTIAA